MPIARFEMPDGRVARFEVPEGTTPEQAQQAIMAQLSHQKPAQPAAKPFGQQINDFVADAPRQVGLTARYGLEGVGGGLDFLATPFRGALNAVGMNIKPGSGQVLADALGLPQPRTEQERVVGEATRMVAGAAVPLGGAAKAANATSGTTQAVMRSMAANPAQQLASAAAAGGAGGYVRETGGNDGSQLLAALGAGVATPLAMNNLHSAVGAAARRLTPSATTPQQIAHIDITISNALQQSGLKLGDLPAQVAQGIRNDVAAAYKSNGVLSPDAIRRLADYRLTGATPTAAGLTLDPAIVTQQKNLAKLGINSKDPVAQQLGQTQNANNRALTTRLNELGAATADDQIAGADKIMGALAGRDARAKEIIGGLYNKARDSAGRSAELDHYTFTNRAADLLHDSNVESFLTPDIRRKLNGFATGEIPLTVEIAEQFKTNIGRLQRNSTDGNVRHALGLVRQALDEAPLLHSAAPVHGGNQLVVTGAGLARGARQNLGQEAIDAFNKARGMNRSWMQIVERTPALQAVRDGIEPDKFVQQFIVGAGPKSNAMDVAMLKNSIKGSPEAMGAVREQITAFLKQRALNGAADEVGNFSQSAYNKALTSIGERKLKLFFKPEEIAQLKAIGRVASYEQFQPAGSAVNNSNTAGAMGAMLLDRIASSPLLSKLPFGQQAIAQPLQNITVGLQANRAMSVPLNLAAPARTMQPAQQGLLVSPAAFMGGFESEEERQRRLLTPGR